MGKVFDENTESEEVNVELECSRNSQNQTHTHIQNKKTHIQRSRVRRFSDNTYINLKLINENEFKQTNTKKKLR